MVHKTTIYRMLKSGSISGFRIGSDWRFNKTQSTTGAWAKRHQLLMAVAAQHSYGARLVEHSRIWHGSRTWARDSTTGITANMAQARGKEAIGYSHSRACEEESQGPIGRGHYGSAGSRIFPGKLF